MPWWYRIPVRSFGGSVGLAGERSQGQQADEQVRQRAPCPSTEVRGRGGAVVGLFEVDLRLFPQGQRQPHRRQRRPDRQGTPPQGEKASAARRRLADPITDGERSRTGRLRRLQLRR